MAVKDKPVEPPKLPSGFPLAGLPDVSNGIDPAVMGKITSIAHMALDGILQWAFQNIAPILLQGVAATPQAADAAEERVVQHGDAAFAQRPDIDQIMAQHGGNRHAAPNQEPEKPAARPKLGPYPHGDMDLGFLGANVAPGPVRPERNQTARRYYFLPDVDDKEQVANADKEAVNYLAQRIINPAAHNDNKLGGKPD
jgi:hypothetical protein